MKLLTIEDDVRVRESIANYFEDSNFTVLQAANGREGLELFRRESPDIVLVDLRMPEIDGLDVIETIKRDFEDTPIIVVSGTGVLADAIKAIRLGAWDYVTKPIEDMAVLEHIVMKAMERAWLIRQNRLYQGHLQEEVSRQTAELEYLYETTPIGLGLCDPEERFVRINRTLSAIGGQLFAAFTGRTIREVLPTLADVLEPICRRVLASEKPELDVEIRGTSDAKPGVECVWLVSCHSVLLPGKFCGVGIVVQDITERTRQEEKRLRLERELRQAQKMEAIGTLAAGIAHDFNNLLTAIWGYVDLARGRLTPDHPAREFLDVVDHAIHDASGIASSLLTFSREGTALKKPVDLCKVIRDSMNLLRRLLPASVEVKQEVPSDYPIYVCADVGLLHQVLMNLITNARDAMPDGGTLRVSLSRESAQSSAGQADPSESATLLVEDTGAGMTAEVLARLFEPFFTTKPRGKGTGLGMAMVHGIIQEHQGRIDVASSPGGGTRISIRLPCCAAPGQAANYAPADASEFAGQGRRVLLAEGDGYIRALIVAMLAKTGYEVVDTATGDDALSKFEAADGDFSLAILGLDLPHRNGLQCAEALRDRRLDMPIIIVTDKADARVQKSLAEQHLVLLRKPFQLSELGALVTDVLRRTASHASP